MGGPVTNKKLQNTLLRKPRSSSLWTNSCFFLVGICFFVQLIFFHVSPAAASSVLSREQDASEVLVMRPSECHSVLHATTTTADETNCHSLCSVTKSNLGSPIQQHQDLDYSGGAKVIFLLGYAFTGTSAAHFLLSTSGNVSTLTGSNCLDPTEEGWDLVGIKDDHPFEERWDGSLKWVNWTSLAEAYGKRWDDTLPLKVENSPPEIQAPEALKATFEPIYGKVKFILLVRGDCTYSGEQDVLQYENRAAGYQHVINTFPEDTFVLRYEDLCLQWDAVHSDLARWEPLLADVDISAVPSAGGNDGQQCGPKDPHRKRLEDDHEHRPSSILSYCESVRTKWHNRLGPRSNRTSLDSLTRYGYDGTNTCADDMHTYQSKNY